MLRISTSTTSPTHCLAMQTRRSARRVRPWKRARHANIKITFLCASPQLYFKPGTKRREGFRARPCRLDGRDPQGAHRRSNGALNDRNAMNNALAKIKEEFLAVIPPTLFFFIELHIVAIVRALMTKATGIAPLATS